MKYFALLTLVVCGCTADYNVERRCLEDDSRQQERADFVLKCAKNANPKSDEEPEDMLAECSKIANKTFCTRSWAIRDSNGRWTMCAHASRSDQRTCRKAGW